MVSEINLKIKKLKEDISVKSKLDNEIVVLERNLKNEEIELSNLEKKLKKEKKDVDNLNKTSFSNFFATIFKNKDEKLEKEKEEYLNVKIKHEEVLYNINVIKSDLQNKKEKLFSIENCEKEYEKVMDEKISILKNNGDYATKENIKRLDDKLNELIDKNNEIREAYGAGKRLLEEVVSAKEELEGAKKWGTFDIIGGDAMSSIAKQSKIRKANIKFERVSQLISEFNKELGDIKLNSLEFSNVTFALDVFFDNIFTDISVQRRINESIDEIENLENKIKEILYVLQDKDEEVVRNLNNIMNEYILFIEVAI